MLRNKKTGDRGDYNLTLERWNGPIREIKHYVSLAELNEEWEDTTEEPIEYWFIDEFGLVQEETEYYYEDNKEAVHDKRIAVGVAMTQIRRRNDLY